MVAGLREQSGAFEGRICQAGRAFGKRQYTRLLAQFGYNRVEKTLHPRENCSSRSVTQSMRIKMLIFGIDER